MVFLHTSFVFYQVYLNTHNSFHPSVSIIADIEILEEFAYLNTDQGGKVDLQIMPSSVVK